MNEINLHWVRSVDGHFDLIWDMLHDWVRTWHINFFDDLIGGRANG